MAAKCRRAEEADLEDILDIHVRSALEIPIVAYRYPGAAADKPTYRKIVMNGYRKQMADYLSGRSNSVFIVCEIPADDNGSPNGCSGIPEKDNCDVSVRKQEVQDELVQEISEARNGQTLRRGIVGYCIWDKLPGIGSDLKMEKTVNDSLTTAVGITEKELRRDLAQHIITNEGDTNSEAHHNNKASTTTAAPQPRSKPNGHAPPPLKSEARVRACRILTDLYTLAFMRKYKRGVLWLRMLCVHPDYRRKGIGALLVKDGGQQHPLAEDWTVGLFSTPILVPWYEKLGFRVDGGYTLRLPRDLDDATRGETLDIKGMALPLRELAVHL